MNIARDAFPCADYIRANVACKLIYIESMPKGRSQRCRLPGSTPIAYRLSRAVWWCLRFLAARAFSRICLRRASDLYTTRLSTFIAISPSHIQSSFTAVCHFDIRTYFTTHSSRDAFLLGIEFSGKHVYFWYFILLPKIFTTEIYSTATYHTINYFLIILVNDAHITFWFITHWMNEWIMTRQMPIWTWRHRRPK